MYGHRGSGVRAFDLPFVELVNLQVFIFREAVKQLFFLIIIPEKGNIFRHRKLSE